MIKKQKAGDLPAAGQYADYMRTWLMMKISAQNAPTVFGKRRLTREWEKYAAEFGLTGYADASDEEKEKRMSDWDGFLQDYCHLCLTDRTYGSTLFGIVPMKADTINEKLLNELNTITELFPERLGLKNLFAPLHEAAARVYAAL
ncbi:MAG: hypothetical protein IJT32_00515 [Lachnospiraceae bacterium]|nr:hypothetical protein [Lachnospiraceae bacterium]